MAATTLEARLKDAIRDVPDFPKPGILFKDITPVLLDPALYDAMLDALTEWTAERRPDKVAGIEARGFLLAAPIANRLGLGLAPVRKAGKLPWRTRQESYDLEYGVSTLEIHTDAIAAGERVVVIDDLLATGGTTRAAVRLIGGQGGCIAGLGFVIELAFLDGRDRLDGYECFSLVRFD